MKISKLSIISVVAFLAFSLVFFNSGYSQDSTAAANHEEVATEVVTHEAHATSEAHETSEAHGEAPARLNAGKLIMEHIGDSHGWHLWGTTEIPLPVIIYNSERGFTSFMSSAFEHGHKSYKGYKLEEGKVVAVNEMESVSAHDATINEELTAKIIDFSITKNVLAIFISIALMLIIFNSVAGAYTRKRKGLAPTGLQNAIEPIIIFLRDDVIKASIGEKKYEKYVPYLLTLFFFIWINNLMGLIPIFPGGANVTGSISVALVLAVLTFLITSVSANKYYWQHIFAMPGVPKGVLVLLTPIEILGMFLRPFVLMIRLFANIAAGHIIALSFFCLIFIFGQESLYGAAGGFGVSPLSLAFTIFMTVLELLVAFLQAYVFTLLSAVYIGAAVEEHHHDDHH